MVDCADLLFELGTEELPPVALKRLSDALTQEFVNGLEKQNIAHGTVHSYAAPRRLALMVSDCSLSQPDREVERRGPAVAAAFDDEGNPTKAAQGFARSCGVDVGDLGRLTTDKGEWLVYQIFQQGKSAAEVLPSIAEEALNKLPIPKRMRWGSSDAQFVRPVHWLLFLHGEAVVPCTILEAEAGNLTYGHRFHHPTPLAIKQPSDYAQRLQDEAYVIADFAQRKQTIRTQITTTAENLGGEVVIDEALLDEVTGLVEWPIPVAGDFEERFLEVPHEALIITMKKNQKYFHLVNANGELMNHFITLANIDSSKPELIKEGNERVVRPRLADAMFFWHQDAKRKLEDHLESLNTVVFQHKLGSMFEKSKRVALLAKEIASGIGGNPDSAHRAGMLSRCDLMTEMVGEFPDMQGIMGRYQATRDNEAEDIIVAMEEFYLPRYSGGPLPESLTGIALSLAEKLDTLVGIFGVGMKPTGDKDPFALRRAALGALRIMLDHALPLDLHALLDTAFTNLKNKDLADDTCHQVYQFMLDRLKGIYLDQDIPVGVFDAVASIRPKSIADFDRRINAVMAFRTLEESTALAAANKRITNILKKSGIDVSKQLADPALFEDTEEQALFDKIASKTAAVAPLLEQYDYEGILRALAELRDSVDQFFDKIMVMAENESIRNNRLALLGSLNRLFLGVADISKLQA